MEKTAKLKGLALKIVGRLIAVWAYPLIFVTKILVFAVFYLAVFSASPDSFRFNDGYNVNPLTRFWPDFYATDDLSRLAEGGVGADLDRMQSQAKDARVAHKAFEKAKIARLAINLEYDQFLDELNAHQIEAYETFQKNVIEPLEWRIKTIESDVENSDPADDVSQKLSALAAMKSELRLKLDSVTRDGFSLTDPSYLEKEARLREELANATQLAITLSEAFREKRVMVSNVYTEARSDILSKIGFADFLYFSACISTTTTFGDITANLPWLRLVVALQIILGIFILAKMLEAFARRQ